MTMPRLVSAETLDQLPADDPAARRSRRDLARVHRAMGTRSILAEGLRSLMPPNPEAEALRILEIGAGDGTLLLCVARSLAPAWPKIALTLLDRHDIVSAATRDAYAGMGWTVATEVVDVIDWAAQASPRAPASAATKQRPWDLITTTLFLHHFEGAQLDSVLAAIASRTDRFFACEPRRSWRALMGSHLVGALGANAVTREDAVLSVHAGFRGHDLTALWPNPNSEWVTREFGAGLFSHCFSARRPRAPE